jgi:peptidoglycan hydrolase CwlO-like protein
MILTTIAIVVGGVGAGSAAFATIRLARARKKIAGLERELKMNEETHETLMDKLAETEAERIALKEANEYLKEITGKTFQNAQRNVQRVRDERDERDERAAHRIAAQKAAGPGATAGQRGASRQPKPRPQRQQAKRPVVKPAGRQPIEVKRRER